MNGRCTEQTLCCPEIDWTDRWEFCRIGVWKTLTGPMLSLRSMVMMTRTPAWCGGTRNPSPACFGASLATRCSVRNSCSRCLSMPISASRPTAATPRCCTGCGESPHARATTSGGTRPASPRRRPCRTPTSWSRSKPPRTTTSIRPRRRRSCTALLARLPADDRLVLTLMYFEECGTQEVAERMGWSRAKVKTQALRARRKMKEIAEREHLLEKLGWTL